MNITVADPIASSQAQGIHKNGNRLTEVAHNLRAGKSNATETEEETAI